MKKLTIDEKTQNLPFIKVVKTYFPQIDAKRLKEYVEKDFITLENEKGEIVRIKQKRKLKLGDVIAVKDEDCSNAFLPVGDDISVVWEDDNLLFLDKPKGIVVHPRSEQTIGDEVSIVHMVYRYLNQKNGSNQKNLSIEDCLSTGEGPERPGIVHRLDKNTSGLLLICKNNKIHTLVKEAFQKHAISKFYLCLVHGEVKDKKGTFSEWIGRHPVDSGKFIACAQDQVKKMKKSSSFKPSITHFKLLKVFRDPNSGKKYSLLEINLETGRTHQIRVHCHFHNHSVVGDSHYGSKQQPFDLTHQMLHSNRMACDLSGLRFDVLTKYPKYFEEVLGRLIDENAS